MEDYQVTLVVSQDTDGDGVDDVTEAGAPNPDVDGNGVPDGEQANIAALRDAVGQTYVTLVAAPGTTLSGVSADDNPSDTLTLPGNFPLGFIQFSLSGVPLGGTAEVMLLLDVPQAITSYYKFFFNSGRSYFGSFRGAEFIDGNEADASDDDGLIDAIRLTLVDGGAGDLDGVANGVIVDPGGPAVNPPPTLDEIIGPDNGVIGQPLAYSLDFTDVGDDTHTATVDWGDGSIDTAQVDDFTGEGTVSSTHAYAEPGDYIVQIELTDSAGNVTSVTTQIAIATLLLSDDPDNAGRQILTVGGTPGKDHIEFKLKHHGGVIEVKLNHKKLGRFDVDGLSRLNRLWRPWKRQD